jgi:hypothetical protein
VEYLRERERRETKFVCFQEPGIPLGNDISSQMSNKNVKKLLFYLDWKGALCLLKE